LVDRNDRGFGYAEELQAKGIDAIFVRTVLSISMEEEESEYASVKS
jgi:L-fucose dehydrogenase